MLDKTQRFRFLATVKRGVHVPRADEAALRGLAQRRPARVLRDTAWCYAVIVAGFAWLSVEPRWWVALVSFVLIGNRQYALSVIAHDGKHGNLFADRRLNNLFTILVLSAPIGVDFYGEKANHRRHHRFLGEAADPDGRLYHIDDKATRGQLLRFLTGLGTFPRAFVNALRSGTRRQPVHGAVWNFVTYRSATLMAQLLIAAAIATVLPWWCYGLFWLAPIVALLFVPGKIRMFCEHAVPGLPDAQGGEANRLVSFASNPVERMLLAPMHMNWHAEHHVWPFVPYYNLARLHALVAGTSTFEVRRSYARFLCEYYRSLPLSVPTAAPALR